MPAPVDPELEALRRRAYAPAADIYADPAALQRLIDLEERAAGVREGEAPPPRAASEAPIDPEEQRPPAPPAARARRPFPRPRRSSVILVAGAALLVMLALVALVLVQRVQVDPLQVGATQVARLAPDPAFVVPPAVAGDAVSGATGYTSFEGFRAVTFPNRRQGGDGAVCLSVYQPSLLTVDARNNSMSYSGQLFDTPSCSAGVFPPTLTFQLAAGIPELAHTELPAGTALQFVYDRSSGEVVVFRG
ncbi:hypothetical protein [Microbacterium trichothecenolyticum]|uniref:Uncharacterized protein n=1 Tax=Microbacterium trichothecenolyticum TaxID=69370 RepID=A0ABU0TRB1_MICTR|nr:hypothetical protein [Microbacterium trichothecenolyticum]MDQ1121489.1 hypothetical protein [Microbacterium trichothecenolyticum]